MNIYCIRYVLKKYNNIKIKRKIDGKMNLYPRCIDCGFKNCATTDERKIIDLLKEVWPNYKTMFTLLLKVLKITKSKNPKVVKKKNKRIILLLNYVVCNSKITRFIKEKKKSNSQKSQPY